MSDEINPYNASIRPPSGSPFAPAPGEVSEVVYELEIEDHVELAMHVQKRSGVLRRQQLAARLGAPILFTVICLATIYRQGFNRATAGAIVIVGIVALIAFLSRAPRRKQRKILRKLFLEGSNRTLLGTRRLRLAPDRLICSSELIESAIQWPAVESIESNADYAYFYIASIQAYVVPRRAFNDDLQFQAFVELARRYWRQATVAPSPAARALA
jgi:hypothetical protein